MQDLCQAHYQILSIIFLKEFIKLNINMDTVITNVKLVEFNTKIPTAFLNTETLKHKQMFMLQLELYKKVC